jgi:uncharacterized protein YdeI (YjbR/CyaY-like superfamily)
MGKKDPRVDAYIGKSAPFAKSILKRVRTLAHQADPEIAETLKWGMPAFMHDGIVGGMAAFKAHCAIWFWKSKLVHGRPNGRDAMGSFGRIAALKDLPADKVLIGYIKKAVALNVKGIKKRSGPRKPAKARAVPAYLSAALKQDKRAQTTFKGLSTSHRNEYIEWITEAKREATRAQRLATTLKWLAAGRSLNWKYGKK